MKPSLISDRGRKLNRKKENNNQEKEVMDDAFSQLVSSTRVSIRAKKLSSRRKRFTLTNLRYLSTMNKYKNLHSADENVRD